MILFGHKINQFFSHLDGHDITEKDAYILKDMNINRKSNYHLIKDFVLQRKNKKEERPMSEFGEFNNINFVNSADAVTNL